jgi:hypothetical protein
MLVPLKRLTRGLFLTIAVIAVLGSAFAVSIAYANTLTLLSDNGDGTTVWLSYGSSAGNTIWTCTSGGCVAHYNDPGGFNQFLADSSCAGGVNQ